MAGARLFPLNKFHRQTGWQNLVWNYVWGPANILLSFGPLLLLNICQMLGLVLYPISKPAYRKFQRSIAFAIWGWWGFAVQRICGLEVVVSGDVISEKENAIVICNHQEMADIIVILCYAFNNGTVTRTTWMAKNIIRYVPGIGWGLSFLDTVFLKRNWARDEAGIRSTFSKIIENQIPIWMTSFPEGTRISSEKLAKSQEFARSRQQPVMNHVLSPRSLGFTATLTGLAGHVSAVYSLTIGYKDRIPGLAEIIRGDVKQVWLHVRRIPISEIPSEKVKSAKWLNQEFQIKDALLDFFRKHGSFPQTRDISLPVTSSKIPLN
jgi:lysocardiolipin and lysophospholipid acyltransferase